MMIEPNTMPVEIKINDQWVVIDEHLSFAEHERNAALAKATEVRTLDGALHTFLNDPDQEIAESTAERSP